MAVDALELSPGDTVVEVGCGTGANLPLLAARVGPTGRVVGVDITDAMLERARALVLARGLRNVELVLSDARAFTYPEGDRASSAASRLG